MKNRLLSLNRFYKQSITVFFDIFILLFSVWISFVLRTGQIWSDYLLQNIWLFFFIPLVAIPLFIKLGLYRSVLKYVGIKVIVTSFKAITILSLLSVISFTYFFRDDTILPKSIMPIFWFVSNTFIITSRFLLKEIMYSWYNDRKKTIVYGAGSAGVQLIESLKKSLEYVPIALIDDDKQKQGTIFNFIEISPFGAIQNIIKKYDAELILIAIPSISNIRRREIIKRLSKFKIEVKILPSLDNIVNGEVNIDSVKHVEVEDILGRDSVKPDDRLLCKNIKGKNILVTGSGGSIGSELCRQIIDLNPKKIILYDNSEYNLYSVHHQLCSFNSQVEIIPVLASVTNFLKIDKVISENEINTIFHAAAYKHVPIVEMNISEGVYNNVIGTYNVAKSAKINRVENMLLISTDKAVRPSNIMGASKRFSELILQSFSDKNTSTCFSMVRFGNVLDSAGSVVPLFRKQIRNGGPITVTHREVTRYFMSIPEAVQLVLQAGAMAKGGDVFVLDMGSPVKILDLAYRMIHLSGLKTIDDKNTDGDIKIHFTGLRPGEKLYEELLIGDNVSLSDQPSIMRAIEEKISFDIIEKKVNQIIEFRQHHDDNSIKEILLNTINGYKPNQN